METDKPLEDIHNIEPCWTLKEAAAYIGIHPMTAARLARNGKLPGRKIGKYWRFDPTAMRDFMYVGVTASTESSEDKTHKESSSWLVNLKDTRSPRSITGSGSSKRSEYDDLLGLD